MFLACCFPLMDTDFWWHLRTGELIFQRGFPDLDWYTFTDFDKPWIDLHWGFQVLMTGIYHVGGASAVVLFKAGILALALAVAMSAGAGPGRYAASERGTPTADEAGGSSRPSAPGVPQRAKLTSERGTPTADEAGGASRPSAPGVPERARLTSTISSSAQILLWLLPAITISGRGYERPEMLSLLFLATWLWIVDRTSHAGALDPKAGEESQAAEPSLMWWLPLLQLVWTNCHALSVLGLVTGLCFAADWSVRKMWYAVFPTATNSSFGLPMRITPQFLLTVGLLTGGVVFLNPWLEEGAFFPLVLYRKFSVDQAFYSANIGEFQRPYVFFLKHGLTNNYLAAEIFLWVLAASSFLFLLLRRRCNVFRLLMFLGFSNLAWAASRNTNIFSLVAGYVLTANFCELMHTMPEQTTAATWFGARGRIWAVPAGLLLAAMIPAVVSGAWGRWTGEQKTFGLGERPNWFMHEASRFASQEGFPRRAFVSHNGQAAVYIYHNSPPALVFMDARLEVSTQVTFERYLLLQARIMSLDKHWAEPLRDSQGMLPVVLLDSRFSRMYIAAMLSFPNWRLVYADKTGAVFLETAIAERLKLPAASIQPLVELRASD